jgi:hypothetical protein
MRDIIPLTQAARARAEGADPNQRRCLIQNCCDDDIVELAYVFPREHSGDSGMVSPSYLRLLGSPNSLLDEVYRVYVGHARGNP